ncbi:MAG: hypothetical protein QOJ60_3133 [Actinomycetota bacterium]|jgi:hypothetical protein|nr:hypothetical protein [Actinomycetota bacterium]
MTTRDDRDLGVEVKTADVQVSTDELVVTTALPEARPPSDPPSTAPSPAAPSGRNRTMRIIAAVVVLGLAATVIAIVMLGGDTKTSTKLGGKPADPAPSGALAAQVLAPSRVVAGKPARFHVTYTDGKGILAGSFEDWGDGVGTSSVKQANCATSPPTAKALTGSYVVPHVWRDAGTYTVKLGVTSYSCASGKAVMEQSAKTLTVTVAAR